MEIKRVVELRKARGEGSISRRGFLRLTAGTTALAGLAACTQVTAPSAVGMPADAPAAAPEQEMHDLIYWNDLTGPDGEIQQAIVDRYNEGPGKEAGVHITFERGASQIWGRDRQMGISCQRWLSKRARRESMA